MVAMLDGKDFDAWMFGYNGIIADSKLFTFYYVKKGQNLKKQYTIFECHYSDEMGGD